MKYKAIIFDLDGTLLDTISDIADSCNAALERELISPFSEDEYKYLVGKGIDVLISSVIEKSEVEPSLFHQLKVAYIEEYEIRKNNKTKIYDGMMDVLLKLKEAGVSLNILSNKPHFQTIKVVAHYFPKFDFDYIYGKKPGFDIKPNPASVLDLIKNLNVKKEDVLYIGDTNVDMLTARNAGLTSVGVLWGFRQRKELEESGADYIVDHPMEIVQIMTGKAY